MLWRLTVGPHRMASPDEVHGYTFQRLIRAHAVMDFMEAADKAARADAEARRG